MNNDLLDLADRLCEVAGMIMEDHRPPAARKAKNVDDRTAKLDALVVAGGDIVKLASTAQVLSRLG